MVEYAGGDRGNKVPFSQLEESSRDGSSIEKAVIIKAANSMEGISAEYQYLSNKYGIRGQDWNLEMQSLMQDKGKSYDVMMVALKDGTKQSIFFDISEFFGK
jgi:hypothetical protein